MKTQVQTLPNDIALLQQLLLEHQALLEAKDSELEAKDSELEAKDSELEAKDSELEAKDSELEAKDSELEAKDSELEAKDSELEAKDSELEAKDSELEAKDSELEAKDSELEAKDGKIAKLLQSYQCLLEQFRLAQKKQFGRSSETHPDQGELFNEAEALVDKPDEDNSDDSGTDTSTNSGKKRQPKRQPLPKDLPRKQEIHDIDEDEKQCECSGHQLAPSKKFMISMKMKSSVSAVVINWRKWGRISAKSLSLSPQSSELLNMFV